MSRVFVIRPFETKTDRSGRTVDFERVHRELIQPVLDALGLSGGTTGEIVEAGNIREDMFQLILEADLVVCDITIHNANVFYELGIRHALRRRRTVLIKGEPTPDSTPFDLLTDRYLSYDIDHPAEARLQLEKVLAGTQTSLRETDSPIFQMVPTLEEADPERVQSVPTDLQEEVQRAVAGRAEGWLRLLADEVRDQRFERSALRRIAKAQWDVKDYEGATESWEQLRARCPADIEVNLALANIYERRSRAEVSPTERSSFLSRSDEAIERVLSSARVSQRDRAETLTLKGRNQKTHWRGDFETICGIPERRRAALNRALIASYESYRSAFAHDLNHYYPGLAAVQMGSLLLDLSREAEWRDVFASDLEADQYLLRLRSEHPAWMEAVRVSIGVALDRDPEDRWARISEADLLFMGAESPARVIRAYEDVFQRASRFEWDAARGQLALYADLGVRPDRAMSAIRAVDRLMPSPAPDRAPKHLVVFAGHQIDEPGRTAPRFPAVREAQARGLIASAMEDLRSPDFELEGLASASPGADILWHEVCDDLGIETKICLPMPVEHHAREVFREHDDWRTRFLNLCASAAGDVLVLNDRPGLPRWLQGRDIDPWRRGNEWVMKLALTSGAERVSLLAFWDGVEDEVTRAGTAQMVQLARTAGTVRIHALDSRSLVS